MIVDIDCEDGTTQIARTVLENTDTYIVNFLERNKFKLYDFIDKEEEVNKASVSGFYDVNELEDTGLLLSIHRDTNSSMIVMTKILSALRVMKKIPMMMFLLLMKKKPKLKNLDLNIQRWSLKNLKNA